MTCLFHLVLVGLFGVAASVEQEAIRLCTDGTTPVECFVQPCVVNKCNRHSNAICVDDYCGGCNARFYVNGTEVTDDCRGAFWSNGNALLRHNSV